MPGRDLWHHLATMRALLHTLPAALASIAAVLMSFGVMYTVCVRLGINASPAIMAAALAMGMMRRAEQLDFKALLLRCISLPLVALAAGSVGLTLLKAPLLGAVLFTAGISLSIVLRRYGPRAAALGRLVALPFITILVVPVRVEGIPGRWLAPLLIVGAGLAALICSALASWLATRLGAELETEAPRTPAAQRPVRESQMHIATRMALQMAAALALAFALGMTLFPAHWFWVVLTAFIVCSGAVGRGDAIYKGIQRLSGAIGGAVLAAAVSYIVFPGPVTYAAAVFSVLFVGIWLRQLNYAWWAACATLVFALLQGPQTADIVPLLGMRVLCIVVGALCAVAATWFIYPIRTEQLIRRRVADALGALREHLPHKSGSPEHQAGLVVLARHAAELERVAPPVRLHRTVFRPATPDEHPAGWIDLMHGLLQQVRAGDFDRTQVGAEMRRLGAILRGESDKA